METTETTDAGSTRRAAQQALQESEARYRDLFECAHDAIFILADGRFVDCNAAAGTMFRCDRRRLVGRRLDEVSPPTQPNGVPSVDAAPVQIARALSSPERGFEWVHRRTDGTDFHAELSLSRFDGHSGPYITVMVRDITDRRLVEAEVARYRGHLEALVQARTAELEIAKARAEKADGVKSSFLATMSHELRTPLNSILGFAGILLRGLPGPLVDEQRKQLGMIRGSARLLLSLITDVLDISRIEAGQLEVVPTRFHAAAAIRRVVESVAAQAAEKGLSLALELGPEIGEITADRRRFEQILLNLLSNAVKFTDQGAVRVKCRRHEGRLEVRVSDTGIGIAASDLPDLFQPFKQVSTGLDRRYQGTGLGLSICKRLALLMGGEIHVESKLRSGSTFWLELPCDSGVQP